MKPEWRTTTVVQLCLGMRETQEYGALPILADALEEAGCDNEKMLGELRGQLDTMEAQRQVALVYSEESAEAVRWMEGFVRDINYRDYSGISKEDMHAENYDYNSLPKSSTDPHTYAYIMEQGESGANGDRMFFGSDAGADYFREGEGNQYVFFQNWSLITGMQAPHWKDASYSCAC